MQTVICTNMIKECFICNVILKLKEVRAILNWKYEKNGDRLIDVASLLLSFLDKGRYSMSVPQQFTYAGKHNT